MRPTRLVTLGLIAVALTTGCPLAGDEDSDDVTVINRSGRLLKLSYEKGEVVLDFGPIGPTSTRTLDFPVDGVLWTLTYLTGG